MDIPKFSQHMRTALVVIILSTILSSFIVIASQTYYIIHSSGSIGRITQPSIGHMSEIRALFVHAGSFGTGTDWDIIAQTCKDYGGNVLIGEFLGNNYFRGDQLASAIDACHSRGLELHALMTVLFHAPSAEYMTVDSSGVSQNWMCPTKEASRTLLRNQVEQLATYDIDGFMFDYTRYHLMDECYCSECKAKFEEWLGESIPSENWPPNSSDFAPGGSRNNEFLEWRIVPLTELVRDMRSWMLAINPDLKFGAAVFTYWAPDNPASRRKGLGQDWNDWIRQGYLDWVSPMLYGDYPGAGLNVIADSLANYHIYATGGPEGKAAVAPFLTNGLPAWPAPVTPEDFKAQIDTVRANGGDGWCIWRYGGPGDTGPAKPDIRDYLSIVDMPETFSLYNINCTPSETTATISWTTSLPATSKVEYSTSPLFNASFEYQPTTDFSYWDIDHIEGTIIEDSTPVTNHSITITDLEEGVPFYFRVQSQDQSGIATSKVYMCAGT